MSDDVVIEDDAAAGTCCGRRQVLLASGAAASAVALTACGSAGERAADRATTQAQMSSAAAEAPDAPIASVADVPVGGGLIIAAAQIVITQPTQGEFKAFSSICPHQGCQVGTVTDTAIICPCHDSHFDIATGDVISGPARRGLTEKTVTLDGEDITVG